jgi:hypothetical protein
MAAEAQPCIGAWDTDPCADPALWFAGYREAPRRQVMRAREGLHHFVCERLALASVGRNRRD